jgi:L-ascorbate metabolism protein UlaG (beta-lactamase superfamily)
MITWLGHAGFKIEVTDPSTGDKKIVFIDPWFNSPVCPESEKVQAKADLILVTHGHFDHCSDAPALSQKTGAPVVSEYELSKYITANGGTSSGMNKGGTLELGWVDVIMVGADHSGGCPADGFMCGAPAGFVLQFKDGSSSVYHGGDTNVFTDMNIISDLYQPKIALLPIGGHYTMSPREAAYALTRLLHSVLTVVPMHFGTMPVLKGNPAELQQFLNTFKTEGRDVRVAAMSYGQTLALSSLVS